jgi:tripartite-type tricarboxylate transporter receptor subunit TctC
MKALPMAAVVIAAMATVVDAMAQPYPSRPITMILPYPPGGPTDTLGRMFAEGLKESLGQPVIVENVGGAAGSIGVARAVRAAADGYSLSFGNVASHVFGTLVYRRPYDLVTDLAPIGLLTVSPMWIVATTKLPAKNLKELIGWLKANPDKANAGIVGPGSPAHLCGIYFQNQTGTKFQFAPYRGAGPVIQDLIAGQIELSCLEASATRPHVQSGKIRAYALLAKKRWTASPEVPTIDEAGVPGLYLPFWHGLWAPKGTPDEIIKRLNTAVVGMLADPAMQARLTKLGVEIPVREQQSPEGLRAHLQAELDKWRPIIDAAGIKPN